MLGAIAGDMIGSVHEFAPIKTTDFPLFVEGSTFTDDTVLTVAVAEAILNGEAYGTAMHRLGRRYPEAGYGGRFLEWLASDAPRPYLSWGNGSAMRVSPVGFAFADEAVLLDEARSTAIVSHDHPEGIRGAQATALAIRMARDGATRDAIRAGIAGRFGYDLGRSLAEIRPGYRFDVSCQGTVPEAIIAFLESTSFEGAVRNAVSLGGDADTLACIAGAIAEAYYDHGEGRGRGRGIPPEVAAEVVRRLDGPLAETLRRFQARYA